MFKKFLAYLLIISLLLPALPVQAEGIYKMVGSGAVTQQDMKISAVNGTTFIDFSDSEAAANKLINHKGYLLKVRDSSKRAIQGYVKAQGTGETLDVDLVINGAFAADTNWNKGAGWSIAGTAVKVSDPTGRFLTASAAASYITGALYKGVVDVTAGVSTYGYGLSSSNALFGGYTTTTGTISRYAVLTAPGDSKPLILTDSSLGSGTFDNFSIKQVLTPSATGVTITSTKGGSTFNFAALDSAFNYNDASGYTYELWQVNNAVEVASGSIAANEMLADTTATNAFVAPVGVDLSAYQTGKYIFAAYNTVGGYGAFGYIKGTAPGGETLGAELLSDPTFDNDAVWTHDADWTIASGVATAVNGLNLTQTATISGLIGKLIKVVSTCSVYTSGTFQHYASDTYSGNISAGGVQTSYLTPVAGSAMSGFRGIVLINMVFTDLSLKQVTDCAATGALIVSAKDGATRSWSYKNALFNPNLASTFKIFYTGD